MSFVAVGAAFGVSAGVAGAVTAVAVVGSQLYSADQQRKGMHQQADALKASQEADARQKVEAETGADAAANAQTAAAKARRRASALALGDPNNTGDTLGAPSAPASTVTAPTKAASSTVLGSAAR